MAEAEASLKKVCAIEDIILGKEWKEVGQGRGDLTKVMITMGRERREYAACTTVAMIRELVDASAEENDPVIYTDGSVQRGARAGADGALLCLHREQGNTYRSRCQWYDNIQHENGGGGHHQSLTMGKLDQT